MLPFHRFALDVWEHQIHIKSSYPTTTNIHVTQTSAAKHVQRNPKHVGSSLVKLSWDMHLIDWLFQHRLMNQNLTGNHQEKPAFKFSTQKDTSGASRSRRVTNQKRKTVKNARSSYMNSSLTQHHRVCFIKVTFLHLSVSTLYYCKSLRTIFPLICQRGIVHLRDFGWCITSVCETEHRKFNQLPLQR